jgi:hypothetical protein
MVQILVFGEHHHFLQSGLKVAVVVQETQQMVAVVVRVVELDKEDL